MKVFIPCERFGAVKNAFLDAGHDAWSCDIEQSDSPHRHLIGDCRQWLYDGWDLVIAFPPCTHIAVSGALRFEEKRRDGRQQEGIDFFLIFTKLKGKWAIENPVGIMSTIYRKPDQIIQPYQFGHDASKKTCLWLNGLMPLQGTEYYPPRIIDGKPRWGNQTDSGQNKLGPSETRAAERGKTYSGIAKAMAEQWG